MSPSCSGWPTRWSARSSSRGSSNRRSQKQLTARVGRLLIENLRAEELLEAEAEAVAQKLGRQADGMDLRRLVDGIKARLAKERGFTL